MVDFDALDHLPDAPFLVDHNGEPAFGAFVQPAGRGFTFWDGSRTYEIGDDYTVTESADTSLTLHDPTHDSTFTFSPISLENKQLLQDSESITTLDELSATVMTNLTEALNNNPEGQVYGEAPSAAVTAAADPQTDPLAVDAAAPAATDAPDLDFTIDDGGKVLELVQNDMNGLAVRDNKKWIYLKPNDDAPTVWDQEWLDVNEDAVNFWDENQNSDKPITRDDVIKYAVNSQ